MKCIAVDLAKVNVVVKWESPKSAIEIRGFVGLAGYCRRFIEGFSKIVRKAFKSLSEG